MKNLIITLTVGLALSTAVAQEQTEAEARLKSLNDEFRAAQREYYDAYRKQVAEAKENGNGKVPSFSMDGVSKTFVPKFQAAAEEFAGTDDAVPFLTWLCSGGDEDAREQALGALLSDHITSPALTGAVRSLGRMDRTLGAERVDEVLMSIVEQNPSKDVQALALHTRTTLYVGSRKSPTDAQKESAIGDLTRAVELAEDDEIKSRAQGALNELTLLQVGMTAPEIVGEDLDGVEFKLSDYRGKVVLLDFWGDW